MVMRRNKNIFNDLTYPEFTIHLYKKKNPRNTQKNTQRNKIIQHVTLSFFTICHLNEIAQF